MRLKYRNLKKQVVQLREQWLEDLAEAMTKDGNTTQATKLEQLKRTEEQRRTARKIKYLRGKLKTGGVTFITLEEPGGTH